MAATAASVHEVRDSGAATNSGGYDATVTSPGTDYSQQNGTQVTFNGTTITATTAGVSDTITITGYTVATTDNGNLLIISGGTLFTAGTYTIISVNTGLNQWQLNSNISSGIASAMTGAMGGSKGGAVTGALTQPVVTAGNTVYVKAGTYALTATNTFSTAGTTNAPIIYIGYTSTRTDDGQVTVSRSSGTITIFSVTGAFRKFKNFKATAATSKGWLVGANYVVLENCKAETFTVAGFEINGTGDFSQLINCWAFAGTSAATAGFSVLNSSCINLLFISCIASGGTCAGFLDLSTASNTRHVFNRCISANHVSGGATAADGFKSSNSAVGSPVYINCISYGNGGSGLVLSGATEFNNTFISNCIFISNGAYGITSDTTNFASSIMPIDYNVFYNNTTAPRNQVPAGSHDTTLSADPFTNGAALNFALTAAGIAALTGTGYPGVMQAGGTGYTFPGALAPAAGSSSGGGGATIQQI